MHTNPGGAQRVLDAQPFWKYQDRPARSASARRQAPGGGSQAALLGTRPNWVVQFPNFGPKQFKRRDRNEPEAVVCSEYNAALPLSKRKACWMCGWRAVCSCLVSRAVKRAPDASRPGACSQSCAGPPPRSTGGPHAALETDGRWFWPVPELRPRQKSKGEFSAYGALLRAGL